MTRALLVVDGLTVAFPGRTVVRDVSFEVRAGECVGIVGASGAGKTLTALSIVRLLPRGAGVVRGTIRWEGTDIGALSGSELRRLRGRKIGMVFQDALGALHPALPVVDQVVEAFTAHASIPGDQARPRALELLEAVGIPAELADAARYPHEWSGGMRQRALIAMAMAADPALLIADEPTTALDVTTQARVLEVLRQARRRAGAALLLITHDLGVIAEMADRMVVMQEGTIVEEGETGAVFRRPEHPHTAALLAARPGLRGAGAPAPASGASDEVLRVEDVTVTYPARRRRGDRTVYGARAPGGTRTLGGIRAVDGVTFGLRRGETLGLVGESGAGKTTLARAVTGLLTPDRGRVILGDDDLGALSRRELRRARSRLQIVFQDPDASLNPRRRVGAIIAEPLHVHGRGFEAADRIPGLLEMVGLSAAHGRRRPRELSGGQRQRVAIARALALEPEILVLDEPVSSLDTAVQARIMDLLGDLRRSLGLSLLLIAHDLTLVAGVADRIGVMKSGRLVELGSASNVRERPAHPYTRALLASVPRLEPR